MSQDSVTQGAIGRMRAERRRRGWSAEDLEDHMRRTAGVRLPRSVIANLENQRRDDLTIEEIVGLAKVFGTTVQWLVWGTGVACLACNDRPPQGFSCNECGRSTSARVADVVNQTAWYDGYLAGVR